MSATLLLALLTHPVQAQTWDEITNRATTAGLSAVLSFGGPKDNLHLGLGASLSQEFLWEHSELFASLGDDFAPAAGASLHLLWLRPGVMAEVTVLSGPLTQLVQHDLGYVPLASAQVALGLALGSDGRFGPVAGLVLVGPYTEVRLETTLARGLHEPRALIGAETLLSYAEFD
ncbi:MAG: hypothetical protein JXX28_06425 [Deltaproteobacteria bacterium]|nr:hypothetical protein [Deltaproteobacteria bacterium]